MKLADVLAARTSFIVLQVLDLITTLIAFHFGAFEVNPLVAHLTRIFGPELRLRSQSRPPLSSFFFGCESSCGSPTFFTSVWSAGTFSFFSVF